MYMSSVKQKLQVYTLRTVALFIALVITLLPLNETLKVQQAEAFFGANATLVVGGNGTIQESLSAAANQLVAGIQTSLQAKELTLDGIAYALAKRALKQMTGNIVTWINSGFQGSPAFVTDLNGFLMDIADQVAGDIIYGAGLGFLCSPFELNVRAALEIQYQESKTPELQSQCTFTGVIDNMLAFGQSFTSWQDWFEITTKPTNNQYGAILAAEYALDISIRNAQGQEIQLLNQGQGFLSMKQCTDVAGGGQDCKVVTPGTVIAEQLNNNLDSGREALIEADEIDEIINALFAQLAEQAVTGLNGLLGLTQSGGGLDGTGDSYLDDMNNDEGGTIGYSDDSDNPIAAALDIEKDALKVYTDISNMIDDAYDEATSTCNVLTSSLNSEQLDAKQEIASGNIIIASLTTLNTAYENASSAAEQMDIYYDYLELESEGYLKSELDVANATIHKNELEVEIAAFVDGLEDECE